jgi:hypothetical protein
MLKPSPVPASDTPVLWPAALRWPAACCPEEVSTALRRRAGVSVPFVMVARQISTALATVSIIFNVADIISSPPAPPARSGDAHCLRFVISSLDETAVKAAGLATHRGRALQVAKCGARLVQTGALYHTRRHRHAAVPTKGINHATPNYRSSCLRLFARRVRGRCRRRRS